MKIKFDFWIEKELFDSLKKLVDKFGINMSAFIRLAIKEKIEKMNEK